jgi:hypothetical protein
MRHDVALNMTRTRNHDTRRTDRPDNLAFNIDRPGRGDIPFDDQVGAKDAAVRIRTCGIWPIGEIGVQGLHARSVQGKIFAGRLDQTRTERATLGPVIGE